jgi:hypothetical protein
MKLSAARSLAPKDREVGVGDRVYNDSSVVEGGSQLAVVE